MAHPLKSAVTDIQPPLPRHVRRIPGLTEMQAEERARLGLGTLREELVQSKKPRYTLFGQYHGAYALIICKGIVRVLVRAQSYSSSDPTHLYAMFDDILKNTSSYFVPLLVLLPVSWLLRTLVFELTTPTKRFPLDGHVSLNIWSWLIPQFDWLQNGFKHIHDAFNQVLRATNFESIYLNLF